MEDLVNRGNVTLLDKFYESKFLFGYGGIAGQNGGQMNNAKNYGNVSAFEPESQDINNKLTGIGGIVGINLSDGFVTNSENNGFILGENGVGGIVGRNTGEISHSINHGETVQGLTNVGGISGLNSNGIIVRTINLADVYGEWFVGGVTGLSEIRSAPMHTSISESANFGTVSGIRYIGGISGYLHYSRALDSYNVGNVIGEEMTGGGFGRIIGSQVSRTYSSAEVTGTSWKGGLIAGSSSSAITDNFYNQALVPMPGTTGITPLNNDDMAKIESFTNFDFFGVWSIIPDESYPFLQWHKDLFIPMKL